MIAITGATGHVGNVLVRTLLESGEEVRVTVPPGADTRMLDGLDLEIFEADFLHVPALEHAFHDCPAVFHLDGLETPYSRRAAVEERLIIGARNVVTACLKAGTRRLVQAVPLNALAASPQAVSMAATQTRAYLEVQRGCELGLDAVIIGLVPTLGPHDYGPSEAGRLILRFGRGQLLAWAEGSLSLVDVRDAVQALLLAASQGKRGDIYTLQGEEVTTRELLGSLQILTGNQPPFLLSHVTARAIQRLELIAPLFLRAPASRLLLPRPNDSRHNNLWVSSPMDIPPRPVRQALVEAVVWFRQRGLLPPHA